MKIPVFTKGKWITWITKLKDVNSKSLQVGAFVYAKCVVDGMSETESHQIAEKAVFEEFYRVKY